MATTSKTHPKENAKLEAYRNTPFLIGSLPIPIIFEKEEQYKIQDTRSDAPHDTPAITFFLSSFLKVCNVVYIVRVYIRMVPINHSRKNLSGARMMD